MASRERARVLAAGLAVLVGSTGLAVGTGLALAQDVRETSGPRFRAATDVVQVDVAVVDAEGRPVEDLDADDFVVEEDGTSQKIESFQRTVPVAAPAEPWLGARVSTNLVAPRTATRTLAVVLDDVHLSERGAARARTAAAQLIEGLGEGDSVVVVSTGGTIWSSGRVDRDGGGLMAAVQRLKGQRLPELRGADQITDFEARRIALHNDSVVLKRVVDRWTRSSKLWEQTWGMDSAPAGSGAAGAALRSPSVSTGAGDARTALGSSSGETQAVLALATQAFEAARQRQQRVYGTLLRALAALGESPGRKTVILLSERFLTDPADRELALVTAASMRANAPIDVVDVGGLQEAELQADQRRMEDVGPALDEKQEMRAGLARLAEESGGIAITGTDDVKAALQRLLAQSGHGYLLGYQPANRELDGTFRRIRVTVRRPGVQVRARRGYFAVPGDRSPDAPAGQADGAPSLREAVDAPFALPGIGLRLSSYTFDATRDGTTRTLLVSELRLDDCRFDQANGQFSAELDVLLTASHFATGRTLGERPVAIQLSGQSDVRGQNAWHRITQQLQLQPGAWLAKLVVRDRRSGTIGSVIHSIHVPEGRGFGTSSAVISDVLSADSGPELQRALPLARRTFAAAGTLYSELEVYDASRDESTRRPRVAAGFTLVRSGGAVRRQGPLTPIESSSDRKLTHFVGVPLRGLEPGDYELVLQVKDLVTGRTSERREPLSLLRPIAPTLAFYQDLLQDYADGRSEDAVATLTGWRAAASAGLAKRMGATPAQQARAAAMLHTDAALALLASRSAAEGLAHLEIARGLLERTERDSSFRRDWLLAVGFQLQARGDRASEALRLFLECQSAFPLAAEARLAAGTVYEFSAFPGGLGGNRLAQASGDLVDQAKRQYREALALDPSLTEARVRLGRTLQRSGDAEEARAELAQATSQGGGGATQALAHLFLGELLEDRGESGEAASSYRKALEQDPTLQQAGVALAAVLWRMGERAATLETLSTALRGEGPVGPPSWLAYHLGLGVRAGAAMDALRKAARS